MVDGSTVIGRGGLVLSVNNPTDPQNPIQRLVRYEIRGDGLTFFYPVSSGTPLKFFDLLKLSDLAAFGNTSIAVSGHLVLSTLPASPRPAFTDVSLNQSSSEVTLIVHQAEAFAQSANKHLAFKELDVRFTERQGQAGLLVNGSVKAVWFGQDVVLDAGLDDIGLVFTYKVGSRATPILLSPLGALDLTTLNISAKSQNYWSQLQALYTFDEGRDMLVNDSSGVGTPVNLTIRTPATVKWNKGYVTVGADSLISSRTASSVSSSGNQPSSAPSTAQKIIDACKSTNEITIATWIQPAELNQGGPARIVTLSEDQDDRFFTLGHGPDGGEKSALYTARLRTTKTGKNGTNPSLSTPNGAVALKLSYVVYTRDAKGVARIYVDGIQRAESKDITGDFSNWKENDLPDYGLALANEVNALDPKGDKRSWKGDIYRVEIYNRALTEDEVVQRYYPSIQISGNLALSNVPVPLSQPLSAKVDHLRDRTQITVQDTTIREVTPLFQFETIGFSWQKVGDAFWTLLQGQVAARLWGNALTFISQPDGASERVLPLTTPPNQVVNLSLDGLGSLTFSRIALRSRSTDTGLVWDVSADTSMNEVILPPPDRRPFDYKTDFRLFQPTLGIENGQFVLKGQWLGQAIALYGLRRNGQLVLQSNVTFDLPFYLSLGPIYEPETALKVVDQVKVCQSPGCRQTMHTVLLVELSAAGFSAIATGSFPWEDPTLTVHDVTVPEFTFYTLPTTWNVLLDQMIDQIKAHANDIFAPHVKHDRDYFFATQSYKPLIYYGTSNSAAQPAMVVALPNVFNADSKVTSDGAIFDLTQSTTGCVLTLNPGNLSSDAIEADYRTFLTKLASKPPNALRFGAVNLIKTRIAERLPTPVDRVLYYYYGFEPTRNYLDLQSGMRLRVDYQNYQFVHPSDRTASNGFVGSGSAYYYINSYKHSDSQYLLGFDSFLSSIESVVNTNVAQLGAGGVIDLLRSGYRKSYYRLFYPAQFSDTAGQMGAERVATLVGADNLAEIQNATKQYVEQGQLQDTSGYVSAYFRGRAVVIPEITVFVQEQPMYVPIGTTIRQLIERYANIPAVTPGQDLRQFQGRFRPRRLIHDGVNSVPSYRFININQYEATASGLDAFDLPVVKGDRFYF